MSSCIPFSLGCWPGSTFPTSWDSPAFMSSFLSVLSFFWCPTVSSLSPATTGQRQATCMPGRHWHFPGTPVALQLTLISETPGDVYCFWPLPGSCLVPPGDTEPRLLGAVRILCITESSWVVTHCEHLVPSGRHYRLKYLPFSSLWIASQVLPWF